MQETHTNLDTAYVLLLVEVNMHTADNNLVCICIAMLLQNYQGKGSLERLSAWWGAAELLSPKHARMPLAGLAALLTDPSLANGRHAGEGGGAWGQPI